MTLAGIRIGDRATKNIVVRNADIPGQTTMRTDELENANILFDCNVHRDWDKTDACRCGEGRISLHGDNTRPTGITIRNSEFRGGMSDGIQNGSNGTRIIANTFHHLEPGTPDGKARSSATTRSPPAPAGGTCPAASSRSARRSRAATPASAILAAGPSSRTTSSLTSGSAKATRASPRASTSSTTAGSRTVALICSATRASPGAGNASDELDRGARIADRVPRAQQRLIRTAQIRMLSTLRSIHSSGSVRLRIRATARGRAVVSATVRPGSAVRGASGQARSVIGLKPLSRRLLRPGWHDVTLTVGQRARRILRGSRDARINVRLELDGYVKTRRSSLRR